MASQFHNSLLKSSLQESQIDNIWLTSWNKISPGFFSVTESHMASHFHSSLFKSSLQESQIDIIWLTSSFESYELTWCAHITYIYRVNCSIRCMGIHLGKFPYDDLYKFKTIWTPGCVMINLKWYPLALAVESNRILKTLLPILRYFVINLLKKATGVFFIIYSIHGPRMVDTFTHSPPPPQAQVKNRPLNIESWPYFHIQISKVNIFIWWRFKHFFKFILFSLCKKDRVALSGFSSYSIITFDSCSLWKSLSHASSLALAIKLAWPHATKITEILHSAHIHYAKPHTYLHVPHTMLSVCYSWTQLYTLQHFTNVFG